MTVAEQIKRKTNANTLGRELFSLHNSIKTSMKDYGCVVVIRYLFIDGSDLYRRIYY